MKKALKKFKIRDSKSGTKFQAIKGRKNFLASETGTIIKKWGNKIPVCVVFPNTYYIGMSNLAVHILYKMLNSYDDILCERCFLGENNECISIESGRPLKSFKCIFFSLSFEMDFINIPKILSLSSIPVNSEERGNDDPLIVAGGICAISNPEPVHSFIDLFIMGDSDALIRAFVNLLDNAIKYTEKGEVTVNAVHGARKNINILISDTGRGIDPKHLPHIFERFYRVDESRTTQGFGLGLAIVQEIVRTHQGTIEASSQIGSGTIFRLHFTGVDKVL